MTVPIHVQEYIRSDMGVQFRGRKVAVPEKYLDSSQVCTPFKEMSSERMPHGMGRYAALDAGFRRIALDKLPYGLAREPQP